MNNYIQPGDVMTLTAPYTRTSGQGALVGHLFGVATKDVASGAAGEFMTRGVHTLAKTSAQAWTVGALIYWDDTNKVCTTSSASGANFLIGCATAVAANPSSTGTVRLNGAAA
jgi:predicted RecA/RadA family phage recombinase